MGKTDQEKADGPAQSALSVDQAALKTIIDALLPMQPHDRDRLLRTAAIFFGTIQR